MNLFSSLVDSSTIWFILLEHCLHLLLCAICYRTWIYLSAACLFKAAPTPPDCIPWRHTSQSQTGFFWVLEGCKAHSVCGNISPQVLAATAQLAELHRICSQKLTWTPLLSAVVTTALMLWPWSATRSWHRASPCSWHRHWAGTEQMGMGKSWLQQWPYCASSVEKSYYLQGHHNSGPPKILLACITSNNIEIKEKMNSEFLAASDL